MSKGGTVVTEDDGSEQDLTTESEISLIDQWMPALYFTSRRLEKADWNVFTVVVRQQHKELLGEIQDILKRVEESI